MSLLKENYPWIVIGLGIVTIGASHCTGEGFLNGPEDWVTEWTAWVASYVALAVAAYSIVKLADGTKTFLENRHKSNKQDQ